MFSRKIASQYYARNQRLKRFGYKSYADYLKSDEWKSIKEKVKNRPFWNRCFICGGTDKIHLHHKNYKSIGTTNLSSLVPLCARHHLAAHELTETKNLTLKTSIRTLAKA